jgi:hypothetical protein
MFAVVVSNDCWSVIIVSEVVSRVAVKRSSPAPMLSPTGCRRRHTCTRMNAVSIRPIMAAIMLAIPRARLRKDGITNLIILSGIKSLAPYA